MRGFERGQVGPGAIVSDSSAIGDDVTIGAGAIVYDNVTVGAGSFIGPGAILGEPPSAYYSDPGFENPPLTIGPGAVVRTGTVLYAGSSFGAGLQTGPKVTIREGAEIGEHCRIGTLSDLEGNCRLGDYVSLHSNVHIGQKSEIGNYVWIFPYVVLTNDPYPPKEELIGVTVEDFAVIATMSVILPGVRVGSDALVGAMSLVRADVEPESVVVGNPAKLVGKVGDMRSRYTGEPVYPWRHYFRRGMPWEAEGYEAWARRPTS
jgi:acetyltransferase-like isoleucine patch superfamily enzyme